MPIFTSQIKIDGEDYAKILEWARVRGRTPEDWITDYLAVHLRAAFAQVDEKLFVVVCEYGGWGGTEVYHRVEGAFLSRESAQLWIDATALRQSRRDFLSSFEITEIDVEPKA